MVDSKSGFIVLYRKMTEWEWYTEPNTMRVFIHCLLLANHTEKKWQGVLIERGSFITSYEKIATSLKLSVQKVRTAINKLKSTGELTIKTTNKYSIISIINYNLYQDIGDNQQATQQTINNQITNNQQSNNNQITTTNNDNNENHYNNDNNDYSVVEQKSDKAPYQEIVQAFNLICPDLNPVAQLTDKRKKLIKRMYDKYSLEQFRQVFENTQNSDWHTGRDKKSDWKADFNWLMNENNFVKMLERKETAKARTLNNTNVSANMDLFD